MPLDVVGQGAFAGICFVGFDIRQPGGVLRTINLQARRVADALCGQAAPDAVPLPAPT